MKRLSKDEIFENLSSFLKAKGIELTEGAYARGIHKSCSILADVINMSQQGLEKAKEGLDQKVDQVRQVIHEKTAPKSPADPPTGAATTATPPPTASAKTNGKVVKKSAATRPRARGKGKGGKKK